MEAKLNNIPQGQNYDLVLRDIDLVEIGYSGWLNNRDELIDVSLPMGLYFIQVHNRGGIHPGLYSLQVTYE